MVAFPGLLPFCRPTILLPTFQTISSRPFSCGVIQFNNSHEALTGSTKLFADAAREEADDQVKQASQRRSQLLAQQTQYVNWDGEESIQDAVLRMLVDKYKPLRGGTIRTAEEKLKRVPPSVSGPAVHTNHSGTGVLNWKAIANEPLLPAVEGHKPWLTTYKVPSHASTSIHLGRFPPTSPRSPNTFPSTEDSTLKEKKRAEKVDRLTRARESTLDYRLGVSRPSTPKQTQPNPVSLKGWASLIEDKIEQARSSGQFNNVAGRGKPMVRLTDESNPFIAREEFLMNRIVQRNGAAPPWVEVQGELESAIESFREILRQSWIRRAIQNLTTSQTPIPRTLTLADVTCLRDPDWEARERSYHDKALEDVNSLVRKYNTLAPYAVRRPYYVRSTEIQRVYTDAGPDILRGIEQQVNQDARIMMGYSGKLAVQEKEVRPPQSLRIRDVIRDWLFKLMRW